MATNGGRVSSHDERRHPFETGTVAKRYEKIRYFISHAVIIHVMVHVNVTQSKPGTQGVRTLANKKPVYLCSPLRSQAAEIPFPLEMWEGSALLRIWACWVQWGLCRGGSRNL